MIDTVIFDIDGTLADVTHRVHHLLKEPKDWDAFKKGHQGDTPLPPSIILEGMRLLKTKTPLRIIYLTGRSEDEREATVEWLYRSSSANLWPGADKINKDLFMRPEGDWTGDDVFKEKILHELIATGHNILFVIEDRKRVVDMWRRNGIFCLQCADGDF